MVTEVQIDWWQLDVAYVQRLVGELATAADALQEQAVKLLRLIPAGAGLAVQAQTMAGEDLSAQAGTAAECLARAAEVLRLWLEEFDVRRRERAAASAVLQREFGHSSDPTVDDVRRAVDVLTTRAAPGLGPVRSGLMAVAYARLHSIDDGWQQADAAAAARIAALLVPAASPTARDPVAAARWWQGLLPVQRDGLLRTSPALLGGMDGLPVSIRDRENRRLLQSTTAHRFQVLATSLERPDATLLEFGALDAHGDGTAVVAIGDLAASKHVAVLVPGMSNEIDDIGRLIGAARAMLAGTRPGDGLAVVAWLGYDTPRVSQVASSQMASAGADRLTSFLRSLRITAPHADVTVIGHSYGTMVAGEAAKQSVVADRLVFVGSPGVVAATATDLLPADRVWAARAPGDPIRAVFGTELIARWMLGGPTKLLTLRKLRVDRFGPDPAGSSFGARRFSVAGSHGHSDYFRPGSTSVRNLTRIATGRPLVQR